MIEFTTLELVLLVALTTMLYLYSEERAKARTMARITFMLMEHPEMAAQAKSQFDAMMRGRNAS